jgi:F-type H+-transporting ATPase subunit b
VIYTPDFWVAVAFVLFFVILSGGRGLRRLASALDARTAASAPNSTKRANCGKKPKRLLAEYKKKRSEAEKEAAAIVAAAKSEAERDDRPRRSKRTEEFVVRRTKLAETKIAQAEAQALADVRAAAAETAVRAAERVLTETVKGKTADDLIANAIKDVKTRLD